MRGPRGRGLLALGALVTTLTLAGLAAAASSEVFQTGLGNPRGIAAGPGKIMVAQSLDGSITRLHWGNNKAAALATIPNAVDVAFTGHGWESYVVTGGGGPEGGAAPPSAMKLWHVSSSGKATEVANIGAFQATDPDPEDLDEPPNPTESNPNGVAVLPDGNVLVSDAAANELLLVSPAGQITKVARLRPETVPWPSTFPFGPPAGTPTPAEAVATAVAVGPDGAYYVSELIGFPFTKGASRIWRIAPGTVNALCDPATPQTGPCRSFATGFSSVLDLTFGRDGTMYVLEMAKDGLGGFLVLGQNPATVDGALWAVKNGVKTELAPGSLKVPGGVAVGDDGALYVTTGDVLGPGAGTVVRIQP